MRARSLPVLSLLRRRLTDPRDAPERLPGPAAVRVARALLAHLAAPAGVVRAYEPEPRVAAEAAATLEAALARARPRVVQRVLAGRQRPVAEHVRGGRVLPREPEGRVARVGRAHGGVDRGHPGLFLVRVRRVVGRRLLGRHHAVAVVARAGEDDPVIAPGDRGAAGGAVV